MTNRRWLPIICAVCGMTAGAWWSLSHASGVPVTDPEVPITQAAVHVQPEQDNSLVPIAPPVITKLGNEYHLSLQTGKQHARKVEYYAGKTLLGASYSPPYKVVISQAAIKAGGPITAKVYDDAGTNTTGPADTQKIAVDTADPTELSTSPTVAPAETTDQTVTNPSISAPMQVTATLTEDSDSIKVQWNAVTTAIRYQIWRNNVLMAGDVTILSYTDADIMAGQTYDYQIVAVATDESMSEMSEIAVMTMPPSESRAQPQALSAPLTNENEPTIQPLENTD